MNKEITETFLDYVKNNFELIDGAWISKDKGNEEDFTTVRSGLNSKQVVNLFSNQFTIGEKINIGETERNKRLIRLLSQINSDKELVELIGTMVEDDHPSMKMTFKIMTKNSPIANFFGVEKMGDLEMNSSYSEQDLKNAYEQGLRAAEACTISDFTSLANAWLKSIKKQ